MGRLRQNNNINNKKLSEQVTMAAKGAGNLPLARVKTIMKSSPEVENVNQESLFLVARATEFFIMYLSKLGQRNGDDQNSVSYADLAAIVRKTVDGIPARHCPTKNQIFRIFENDGRGTI